MKKELLAYKFSIHDELNPLDTENSTFGCRCNNPDICVNCESPTCGLYNKDHICSTPSRAWKKIYKQKLEKNKTNKC